MDDQPLEKCPRCFAELREAWQFCPSCGLPLDPALSSGSEVSSHHISYVERPATPTSARRPSRRESLLQSGLHLLVLLAFIGIVTGGLLVLSPDLLGRILSPVTSNEPTREDPRKYAPRDAGVGISVDEIEFVHIPAGEVRTGDPETWKSLDESEIPRTPPDPYDISMYEITNYQYFEYLADEVRDQRGDSWKGEGPASHWRDSDYLDNPKPDLSQFEEPVRGVTFDEATDFCRWLSRRLGARIRLPYWFEWEKAARGPQGFKYPWGNEWDHRRCNSSEGGPAKPVAWYVYGAKHPEGEAGGEDTRDRSPYGVFNMAGNVCEWVKSGAELTQFIMGGDYASDEWYARTWVKTANFPSFRAQFVGFRVVREVN